MRLRPVDRVILGYIAVTSLVAAARLAESPGAPWVLGANALVVLLVWLTGRTAPESWLRDLYPVCILLALYGALDLLAGYGAVATHDDLVQGWEAGLFGGQPSLEWSVRAPSRTWSTVFHAAYFSYYLILPAGPLWFLWKGDRIHLRLVVLAEMITFVICYLVFIFFPVAGPYYQFPRPAPELLDNGPARLVYALLWKGSSYGAAFPSSHVAAVLATAMACAFGSRALALVLAVPALLLTVGVVYTRMHYAVDALAGLLVALAAVALARSVRHTDPA